MYDERVLEQFKPKEIRFIEEEYKRIVNYFNREKGINCITFAVNG